MKFEVDTSQLTSATGTSREILDEISDDRARMYSAMRALDGMWAGKTHDAFVVQYEKDDESMKALIQDISTVIDNFGTARENYDRCEESAKDIAGRIRV